MGALRQLSLWVLPLLVIAGGFAMKDARGPYWLRTNFDPDYVYLTNALHLARGEPPSHVDHPGTPVQEIGAAVLFALHAWNGTGDLARDVLTRPEAYLAAIHGTLLVLFAFSLFIIGAVTLRATGDLRRAALLQLLPLAWPGLEHLSTVQPEHLLLAIHVLLAAALVAWIGNRALSDSRVFAGITGVLAGLGIVTKLTFIWIPLLPPLLLSNWRLRFQYVGSALVAAIVVGAPALPRTSDILFWIRSLATHTGHYGEGPAGFDIPKYAENLRQLIAGHPELVLCIALGVIGAWLWRRQNDPDGRRAGRLISAAVVLQVLQIAMVAKHPKSHYLLPAFGIATVSVFLVVEVVARMARARDARFESVAILAAMAICAAVIAREAMTVWAKLVPVSAFQRDLHHQVETRYAECAVVTYFKASAPASALRFGNYYAEWAYTDLLVDLYPRHFFFELETDRFLHFFQPTSFDAIRAAYPCVVLQGVPVPYFADALPEDVRTINTTRSTYETIYRAIW